MIRNSLFSLAFLLLLNGTAGAQHMAPLDSLCAKLISKYKLPGIAIVGVRKGEVLHLAAYGEARSGQALTDSTALYIASNTKAMTAWVVHTYQDRGLIDPDQSLDTYLDASLFPPEIDLSQIKVRDLLLHSHGLSNDPMNFRMAYSGDYPADPGALLRFTQYREEGHSKAFHYNNLGYLLCGMLIEARSGLSWRDAIEKEVFEPLGMQSSSCRLPSGGSPLALPFRFDQNEPLSSQKSDNTLHAAGGVFSDLRDMSHWLRAFTDPHSPFAVRARACLTDSIAVNQGMGPFAMKGYASGWILGSLNDMPLNFHFGSFHGYESMISFQPDSGEGVFVFVNEMAGGQRIAALITAAFYTSLHTPEVLPQLQERFSGFIDPLYAESETAGTPWESPVQDITGTYRSPEYGQLILDRDSRGYTLRIGRMCGRAMQGSKPFEFWVEWTPGIRESFRLETEGDELRLVYGEFGTFSRK